jgi:hypothetical protein
MSQERSSLITPPRTTAPTDDQTDHGANHAAADPDLAGQRVRGRPPAAL